MRLTTKFLKENDAIYERERESQHFFHSIKDTICSLVKVMLRISTRLLREATSAQGPWRFLSTQVSGLLGGGKY